MKLSRREFGAVFAATLNAPAFAGPMRPAAGKELPVAVETWCFKEQLAEEPEAALAEIAEMGYEGIELAHYYRWSHLSKELMRRILRDTGLKCCSSHLNLQSLEDENLAATIEYHKTIGNSVLIVASLPHQENSQGWKELAKRFDELAAKVREEGMRLGYHNHMKDFVPLEDGLVPWEVFFDNTSTEVIHQLDVGNMPKEYQTPIKYLEMYPGRTQSIHLKDRNGEHRQVLVGDGILPFKKIFNICESSGGTEWYIVEYENEAVPPMESLKQCLANVRAMQAAS